MASSVFWQKQITCPVCSGKFTTQRVRQGTYEVERRDTDYCAWYKGVNPTQYSITVCSSCGFSATNEDFERIDRRSAMKFRDVFKPGNGTDEFSAMMSPALAVKAHLRAIDTYKLRSNFEAVIAGLYLRIAWLYRQQEDKASEQKYLAMARDFYKTAYETARNLPAKLGDVGVSYLIGEISRRLGENNEAIRWFNVTISNKRIKSKPNIEKLARAQWQVAREGYVDVSKSAGDNIYFSYKAFSMEELKDISLSLKKYQDFSTAILKQFETTAAGYIDAKFTTAVTDAMHAVDMALEAANVGQGDEVILPALAPQYVVFLVNKRGAECKIVDIENGKLTADPAKVVQFLNSKTKAVIVSDYAGGVASVDVLITECRKKGVKTIELALESFGTKRNGVKIGTTTDLTVFDLNTMSHLSTLKGALIATEDENVANLINSLVKGGKEPKKAYQGTYDSSGNGAPVCNIGLGALNARVGLMSLKKLDATLAKRESVFKNFIQYLDKYAKEGKIKFYSGITNPVCLPVSFIDANSSIIEEKIGKGKEQGVEFSRLPAPLTGSDSADSCPNAEKAASSTLLLPVNSSFTQMEIEKILTAFSSLI